MGEAQNDLDGTAAFERDWGLTFTPYIFFAQPANDVGSQQIRQSSDNAAWLSPIPHDATSSGVPS